VLSGANIPGTARPAVRTIAAAAAAAAAAETDYRQLELVDSDVSDQRRAARERICA